MVLSNALAAVAVSNSQFGRGEGNIFSNSFACNGDESALSDCTLTSEEPSCMTVAGVVCFPGAYEQQFLKMKHESHLIPHCRVFF